MMRAGWRMVGRGRLERFEEPLAPPPPGWVTVEVAGCGVCHTDLAYLFGGVPTAAKGPLVLGHEIAGRVIETGRAVIVPAVSPCGECRACRRGRPTACAAARMPGNHHDGGFATHVQVPGRWLCEVPPLPPGRELWQLAAVADAVTTPLQAARRARLGAGEVAVVVGAGGVGGFLVEIAVALGAPALALDVVPERLERAAARGALAAVDATGHEPRTLKQELSRRLAARGLDAEGWHVFECSGTPAGQTLAFGLLTRGATLSVVGFSPEALPLKLSNLMALDAEAYGNWGCDPALYPDALSLVLDGKVDVAGAVEAFPLSDAPAVLEAAERHAVRRRAVLVPHA
jgi:6-hydroxycyclohex-1-ene-1-carbonyl-CoA dehydrogenase